MLFPAFDEDVYCPGDQACLLVRLAVILFAIGTGRLMESPREDARKGLLRVKAVAQTNIIHTLVRFTQIAGGQQ